jgi:hypothetical protein
MISPVELYANPPSMLKLSQPTQSRTLMLVSCFGGITDGSNLTAVVQKLSPIA